MFTLSSFFLQSFKDNITVLPSNEIPSALTKKKKKETLIGSSRNARDEMRADSDKEKENEIEGMSVGVGD